MIIDTDRSRLAAFIHARLRRPERHDRGRALAALRTGEAVDPVVFESVDRMRARASYLGREDLAARVGDQPEARRKLFEAVVDDNDMLPRRFLDDGVSAARAVGRIVVALPGGSRRFGTGSLVSSRLVLTNHHVIPSPAEASQSTLELDRYDRDRARDPGEAQAFRLAPRDFFHANVELDYSLVAVEPDNGRAETRSFGCLGLLERSGKALVGERLNIIQQPRGAPQMITIRANTLVDVFDHWLHYTADTDGGSSGAPLFNDAWQLVGIHHAAVPDLDWKGRRTTLNEGTRVSAIVDDLVTALS